jgi:glucokinase
MMGSNAVAIGVDVGGTTMSAALVTAQGEVLFAVQIPTHRDGRGTALDGLLRIVDEVVAKAGERRLPVSGIGIGLPGIVDAEGGIFQRGIARIPELTEIPLAERIQAKTGMATFLENDVNALALAESAWGLGHGAPSLVMLALGTGLGGALILDGRLVRGKNGYAGEFGHASVDLDGRPCICGIRGCLATYAAGFGIATEARRRAHRPDGLRVAGTIASEDWEHDAEAVFRAAARGDATANAVIAEACQALGSGLGGLVNGLNPDVIVVTGGIATGLMPRQKEILDWARRYALAPAFDVTAIHLIPGEKTRTARGGAALVFYEQARRVTRP